MCMFRASSVRVKVRFGTCFRIFISRMLLRCCTDSHFWKSFFHNDQAVPTMQLSPQR